MALELHSELLGELAEIRGELARVSGVVGHHPDQDGHGGTGLAGTCARLVRVLGQSPDGATGEPGSGLCRVLAELAEEHRKENRRMASAGAIGAASAAAVVEVILQLSKLAGG